MAAGYDHVCALRGATTTNEVVCWGSNEEGKLGVSAIDQCRAVPGLTGVLQIVANRRHTCALLSDRTVRCWGRSALLGGASTTTPVPGLTDVVQITAGGAHTCALRRDGGVRCWGANDEAQLGGSSPTVDISRRGGVGLMPVTQLAAGLAFTCAIVRGGSVQCWGANGDGQLGGSSINTIIVIPGLTNVTQVAAGQRHACALLSNGAVRCWGSDSHGQLGGSSTTTDVPALPGVMQVVAGAHHTCALLANGSVRCWGDASAGQRAGSSAMTDVPGLFSVTELSASNDVTCARIFDGSIRCWGDNDSNQLGVPSGSEIGTLVTPVCVPGCAVSAPATPTTCGLTCVDTQTNNAHCGACGTRCTDGRTCRAGTCQAPTTCPTGQTACGTPAICVNTQTDARHCGRCGNALPAGQLCVGGVGVTGGASQLAAGETHTCAITAGTVRCWGSDIAGERGDGDAYSGEVCSGPSEIPGMPLVPAVEIASGSYHTCARLMDNTVRCWGSNREGQLGDGSTTLRTSPVAVMGLTNVAEIAAGYLHTCARLMDNTVRCWGSNVGGQLGDGSASRRTSPVAVMGLTNVVEIAASATHTCARLMDNTVRCWGSNSAGQLGDGGTENRSAPVAVMGLTNVVQIAAGGGFTCARLMDNSVRCWGANGRGQLGDGSTEARNAPVAVMGLTNVAEIAASTLHACARLMDNTLRCWGGNSFGQLGDGSTTNRASPVAVMGLTNVVEIAAGRNHTCARLMDNTVRCWGFNSLGQLGDGSFMSRTSPVAVACFATPAAMTCPTGQTSCGMPAMCVDTQTTVAHCGGCGMQCALANVSTQSCVMGACAVGACAMGFGNCDNMATNGCETNTQTSVNNCGMCGRACPSGQMCVNGACASSCTMTMTNCSGDCVNTQTDTAHCGGCNMACALANVSTQSCVMGACAVGACAMGFGNCDNMATNGCETDIRSSNTHCGACNNACPSGQTCQSGMCTATCTLTVCGGACVDTQTTVAHCGGCNMACALANVLTQSCASGACAVGACNTGFANCDNMAGNGCETDIRSSNTHCGVCNNACPSGQMCVNGACASSCTMTTCSGACVNTQTDTAHCGGCNMACALANVATQSCASGACAVGTCNTGFGNCDNNAANGCETNTQTSNTHCGACNNACPSGQACTAGACVPTMTAPGDACAMPLALDLTQPAQTVMGTTAGMTNATEGCAGGADVFYRFTLTRREVVYFDTFGTSFDTQLRLHTNNCAMAVGTCADNACGGNQSQLVQVLDAGTYILVVDGATGASGAFTLRVHHLPAGSGPVNPLTSMSGTQTVMATSSGASGISTSCGGGGVGPEAVWWLATCPDFAGGAMTAGTCGGASFDTVVEQQSAARMPIAVCNDDTCGTQSRVMSTLPSGAGLHTVIADAYFANMGGAVTVAVTLSPAGGCTTPEQSCGGMCVNTQTSSAHCGTCNNACPSGQTCTAGVCTMSGCPTGQTSCGGMCVNTQTSNTHCGMCGRACPSGQICAAGACAAPTLTLTPTSSTRLAGGDGGTLFEDACPAGAVFVGVDGFYTGSISAMRIVCRDVSISYPGGVPTISLGIAYGASAFRGMFRPGQMGASTECPEGQVVVGFTGFAGSLVDSLSMRCAPIVVTQGSTGLIFSRGTITTSERAGGTGGSPIGNIDCPVGQFAGGALIRAGSDIDAFGLSCIRFGTAP